MYSLQRLARFARGSCGRSRLCDPLRQRFSTYEGSPIFPNVRILEEGEKETDKYRFFFKMNGEMISPWHDLPAFSKPGYVTMVNEIPRGTNAKFEIATKEKHNPIKQDIKNEKLRFMKYGNVLHNYGAIPQTWEDPDHTVSAVNNLPGDNDPLDVIDIGRRVLRRGEVVSVKVVGVLGLIDDNECDWKIIGINSEDHWCNEIHDIDDLERLLPGCVHEIREWYRLYKTVDGKPENAYAFDGEAKGKEYAEAIIKECHEYWKTLKAGNCDSHGLAL